MKQKMVLGIFRNREDVDDTVEDLKVKGYHESEISVITQDTKHNHSITHISKSDLATDTATGGVIGALAGLLIGVAAIAIPGVGGILVGGPIAAVLGLTGIAGTATSTAITGTLIGSLTGGLIGIGFTQQQAQEYESSIKDGGTLIVVPLSSDIDYEASSVMKKHNSQQLNILNLNI